MFSARHLVKRENLTLILHFCNDSIVAFLHNCLKLVSFLRLKVKHNLCFIYALKIFPVALFDIFGTDRIVQTKGIQPSVARKSHFGLDFSCMRRYECELTIFRGVL